ncbi:large subunit GTPase 1 homolog [Anneissia japonica]|uniref:large subunit GTPase 1 homolog n=1 Tax=Anneissia japonica TaxID=1529436 RepID=UPI0014256AC2|nr:large subunit GTPase 1 homolog [Anneissia japonica]
MPGKKKATTANLGSLVIKDRFKGSNVKKKNENSWMHTSELQDGYDWGRLNLQSVTEQSNLDDFLATAELAGTEFAAEKMNIKVIDPNLHTGLPNKEELAEIREKHAKNQSLLTIPRRPQWNSTTTPDELERMERESFLKWRKHHAVIQEEMQILMTPFERNLEVWRQLWRVIERSDIVVQIVDARNPLMFRCPDLEKYVKEVNPLKENIILVNKADLLSKVQRQKWKKYCTDHGIQVAFWSAKAETDRIQKLQSQTDDNQKTSKDEEDADDEEEEEEDVEPAAVTLDNRFDGINVQESLEETSENQQTTHNETENQSDLISSEAVGSSDMNQSQNRESNLSQSCESQSQSTFVLAREATNEINSITDSKINRESHSAEPTSSVPVIENKLRDIGLNSENREVVNNRGHEGSLTEVEDGLDSEVLNGDQLIDLFKTSHTGQKVKEGQLTIGLVGYPNVGKSSTINALLQCKKVQVSSTPGRTKHFQTLYLDSNLLLCDCPGLVMPSFVSTKAEMVTNGVLPIDQMRDFKPAINLVSQVIPRRVFETTYGITIIKPKEGEDPNRPPSAMELVNAYAYIRGFMNTKGMPDAHRASRLILKDFVNGRLLYCHPPPGVCPEDFEPVRSHEPDLNEKRSLKDKQVIVVSEDGIRHKHHPENSVDTTFFQQQSLAGHSKGVHGVKDFSRVSNYTTHASKANLTPEERALAKPWKKHGNRNKKAKLRKTYGHLDIK